MKHLNIQTAPFKALKTSALCLLVASTSLLTACGSSSNDVMEMATYEVTVTNLSANQPLSPLAVLLHNANYKAWSVERGQCGQRWSRSLGRKWR